MFEFTRKYGQKNRPGHERDRSILMAVGTYEKIVAIALVERATLKEVATRLLDAGLVVYEQSKESV